MSGDHGQDPWPGAPRRGMTTAAIVIAVLAIEQMVVYSIASAL